MNPDDLAALRSQLERHEGRRLTVYPDSRGIPTIGVGRNLRDKGISQRMCDLLLDEDLEECLADLSTFPWFPALDPVRQRGCLDLRFNLGGRKFRTFSKFIAAMARQDYITAALELEDSLWRHQVSEDRAVCVIGQIRDGAQL